MGRIFEISGSKKLFTKQQHNMFLKGKGRTLLHQTTEECSSWQFDYFQDFVILQTNYQTSNLKQLQKQLGF